MLVASQKGCVSEARGAARGTRSNQGLSCGFCNECFLPVSREAQTCAQLDTSAQHQTQNSMSDKRNASSRGGADAVRSSCKFGPLLSEYYLLARETGGGRNRMVGIEVQQCRGIML